LPERTPAWRGKDLREMPTRLEWNAGNDKLKSSLFSFRDLAERFEPPEHTKEVHATRCTLMIADGTHWSEDTLGLPPKTSPVAS
jgi:hypothetical protein